MKSKYEMYKTAYWVSIGHYVKLIKFHKSGGYYDIETISGEKGRALLSELSSFVL